MYAEFASKKDRLGKDWRVCCQCENFAEGRTEVCLGPELNAPIYQEGADEDADVVNQSGGRARVEIDGINNTRVDDMPRSSGGVDLGFLNGWLEEVNRRRLQLGCIRCSSRREQQGWASK